MLSTDVDVATITLTADKNYDGIEALVCCTQDTYWKVVQEDDGTPAILADMITGAGQYSFEAIFKNIEFTAGSSGTQELKIIGNQLGHGKASDLYATLTTYQVD